MHVARLQDWVVILTVMGGMAALYLSALFIVIRPFIVPAKIRPKLGLMGALILVATAFSIACIAYAYFIEPYHLETKYVKLQLASIPASTKPITIVQISDLHCDGQVRLENKVAEEIEKIKPSLILFTGDAVNSLDGVPIFNSFANRVSKVAPTMAVKGDWDFAFHPLDVLHQSKLDVLGGSRVFTINGIKLCVVGTDSGTSCKNSLQTAPKGLPTIMMYHNPDGDVVLDNDTQGIDLYLCGHTHGGQIALPFYGAMITQSIQGKKYESGLHKLGNAWIYINRGIGMEGHFPRFRFFAPPELTVFELSGSGG
jgi:uncharacterized protein